MNETPTEIINTLAPHPFEPATVCDLCLKGRNDPIHPTEPGRFAYVELRKVHIEVFDGAIVNDLRRAQNFLTMFAEQLASGA